MNKQCKNGDWACGHGFQRCEKCFEDFARKTLKEGLAQLTEGNNLIFRRMYRAGNRALSTNDVVEKMNTDKLDWAMRQVQRSLDKQEAKV